jgi:hypothetical protein
MGKTDIYTVIGIALILFFGGFACFLCQRSLGALTYLCPFVSYERLITHFNQGAFDLLFVMS